MSDSLGLVDFAIGLVNSILNLHDGQVKCLGQIYIVNYRKTAINSAHQYFFRASSNDSCAGKYQSYARKWQQAIL